MISGAGASAIQVFDGSAGFGKARRHGFNHGQGFGGRCAAQFKFEPPLFVDFETLPDQVGPIMIQFI